MRARRAEAPQGQPLLPLQALTGALHPEHGGGVGLEKDHLLGVHRAGRVDQLGILAPLLLEQAIPLLLLGGRRNEYEEHDGYLLADRREEREPRVPETDLVTVPLEARHRDEDVDHLQRTRTLVLEKPVVETWPALVLGRDLDLEER